MIQRGVRETGIETEIGCHSFRATGITVYLTYSPVGKLGDNFVDNSAETRFKVA